MVDLSLNAADKRAISEAIRAAEKRTSGEIRVHLARRAGNDPLQVAKRAFKRLGMGKTRERNAVLLFVAIADRRFAILGDKGIDAKVGADFWDCTRDLMQARFERGEIRDGIVEGVRAAGESLTVHFPRRTDDRNELSNEVTSH